MRIQLLLLLCAASQLGATDCGEVLRDPGFDLWCGDELCTWKVVRGEVRRVDTWHEGDAGVELLGFDAAIAQLSPVHHGDGTCIRFDLVANVAEDAEASLNLDIYGDGSIDHAERIPTASWKPLSYRLRLAAPFTGIRFELAKRGPGAAVFANIGATVEPETSCDGLTGIRAEPAPAGAYCIADADCASGACALVDDPGSLLGVANRCVGCDAASCGAGDTCGIAEPISPVLAVPLACVPAGGDPLGAQCATGAECASGICNGRACSTCDAATPCANEVCAPAWPYGPHVCSPGGARRTAGEPCATDGDCASGRCTGAARAVCSDGRPCGNDTNCPAEDGLVPGACTPVGVTGGTCT